MHWRRKRSFIGRAQSRSRAEAPLLRRRPPVEHALDVEAGHRCPDLAKQVIASQPEFSAPWFR
jgi:hypothetical protein